MAEHIFTDAGFESEVVNAPEVVLVDFWAPWCGPCRMQGPIVEDLAHEYEGQPVKIGKLNVDEQSATAAKFAVRSIPTLIIFKGGQAVEQMVGLHTKEQLKEKIEKYRA